LSLQRWEGERAGEEGRGGDGCIRPWRIEKAKKKSDPMYPSPWLRGGSRRGDDETSSVF